MDEAVGLRGGGETGPARGEGGWFDLRQPLVGEFASGFGDHQVEGRFFQDVFEKLGGEVLRIGQDQGGGGKRAEDISG